MSFKIGARYLSVLMAAVLLLSPVMALGESKNQTLKEQYPVAEFNGIASDDSMKTYNEYLEENGAAGDTSGQLVDVDLSGSDFAARRGRCPLSGMGE